MSNKKVTDLPVLPSVEGTDVDMTVQDDTSYQVAWSARMADINANAEVDLAKGTGIVGNDHTTATSANVPLTLVARDSSGVFSAQIIQAGTFIGTLTGTAYQSTYVEVTPETLDPLCYPLFVGQVGPSYQQVHTNTNFNYNAATNTLTVRIISTTPVDNNLIAMDAAGMPKDSGIQPTTSAVSNDNNHVMTSAAVQSALAGLAASGVDFLGGYNASTNLFPTVGSGSGGSVQRGDLWIITVAGTLGGRSVLVNDSLLALVNSPGQTSTNWAINSANVVSVFGRTGNVIGGFGDYSFSLISGVNTIAQGGTGQTTANAAFNALAPSQTSNANKFLRTDGTNTSWVLTTNSIALDATYDSLTTSVNSISAGGDVFVCPSPKGGFTVPTFTNLSEIVLLVAPSGNAIGSYNLQLVDANNKVLGITFNVCGSTTAGFNTSSIQVLQVVDSFGVITASNISNYMLFRGYYRSNIDTPYFIVTCSMPYTLPYANDINFNTYQYSSSFLNENYTISASVGIDISYVVSAFPPDLVFKMKVFSANVTASTPQGYLYLPAGGSNKIYQWSINPSTGALTPLSPTTQPLTNVYKIGITYLRNYLYASIASGSTIAQFRISATDGTLVPLSSATAPAPDSPTGIAVDPTDRFAYVCGSLTGEFGQYTIDHSTGELVPIPASSPSAASGMQDAAVHPSGKYLYAVNALDGFVYQYSIDPSTGELRDLPTLKIAAGSTPFRIVVHPSGSFAYVANSGTNTISQYSINPSTGQLAPLPAATFTAGNGVYGLAISNNGRWIFYSCNGANTINQSTIDLTTGLISTPTTSQIITAPKDCCIDYTGSFLFVYGNTLQQVTPLTINQTTGAITLGTAVTAGANAAGIGAA